VSSLGSSSETKSYVAPHSGERHPNSAAICLPTLLLSTVLGMAMGVAAAVRRDTWVDKLMRVVAVLGQSMPAFWVSIMAIFVFSVVLRVLPTSGMGSPDHYILPIAVLTFFAMPMRMRLMRS